MSSRQISGILLGVVGILVLAIGGLSAILLFQGNKQQTTTAAVNQNVSSIEKIDPSGRELRLPGGEPVTLDPHLTTDAVSGAYIVEIYSGLVTMNAELEIVPDLAESIEISPDGLVYIFSLREDAKFHDGRGVTAEDVVWSIQRAASPELRSTVTLEYLKDIVGVREYYYGLKPELTGVVALDTRTIQITIDSPKPYFLAKLTYPSAFIVDRSQIESNRNWVRSPNATGPYKLAEWNLGESIVLEASEHHYLGLPSVHRAIYTLAGGSALTRFENDELDVAYISINDIDRARDPSSSLYKYYQATASMSLSYIAFNVTQAPFDDVHVRRAMAMAIDRQTIAEVTFNGMTLPATGILPPGVFGYTEVDKTLPYDPEAARAEFLKSKYTSSNMPPIVYTETGGGASAGLDTQAFIEQWRQVLGLEIEVRQADWASFLDLIDSNSAQMWGIGWSMDYPDPENILDIKLHGESRENNTLFSSPAINELLEKARANFSISKRITQYQEAESLLIEAAPWIPLWFGSNHVVVSENIEYWFEPPMTLPRLQHIKLRD
jgi:oligopeptide transport system substrate-binding protein